MWDKVKLALVSKTVWASAISALLWIATVFFGKQLGLDPDALSDQIVGALAVILNFVAIFSHTTDKAQLETLKTATDQTVK